MNAREEILPADPLVWEFFPRWRKERWYTCKSIFSWHLSEAIWLWGHWVERKKLGPKRGGDLPKMAVIWGQSRDWDQVGYILIGLFLCWAGFQDQPGPRPGPGLTTSHGSIFYRLSSRHLSSCWKISFCKATALLMAWPYCPCVQSHCYLLAPLIIGLCPCCPRCWLLWVWLSSCMGGTCTAAISDTDDKTWRLTALLSLAQLT